MRQREFVCNYLRLAVAAGLAMSVIPAYGEVFFDDSQDPMVLGNGTCYEIGLSRVNGGITFIRDTATGGDVSLGNSYQDLWRVKFLSSGLIRSSSFSAGSPTRTFSYLWDSGQGALTLTYDYEESGQTILVTVTLGASDENFLDLSVAVENGYGYALQTVYFPSELAFDMNEVEQFYFPYYEGVAFQRSFFLELRSTFQKYQHLFTDFAALESTEGNLALYALPSDFFQPATLGLGYTSWAGGASVYHHMFHTYVADGEVWVSPLLRLRVGSRILETLGDFRTDRGWDALPTVQEKSGDLFQNLAGSFLVKIDCQHVHDWGWAGSGSAFAWVDSVASLLPASSLLHLVSFWPAGFDNYYPDYLPPNPDYGTEAELLSIFGNAHARGQTVMPYTNPTWWDNESPTFDSLGIEIVASDLNSNPVYECYGANCGYVVCPSHLDVRNRLARTVEEFTELYPADILFEDQVADRPWLYDTNPAESSYVSYTDGLIENVRGSSQEVALATEGMLDVLLDSELGFFDSVMLDKKAGWVSSWGSGNWVVYPMTMLLAHDKALFYQHNLAVEVMTHNKEMLTYNLSYGFGLGFDLTGQSGMLESPWLSINEAFQRAVAARCCGKRMTDFEFLDVGKTVTRSVFGGVEVVGNHATGTFDYGDYRIAPQGLYAASSTGDLIAGVFTRFNGVDLAGEHFLVLQRPVPGRFMIEQPSGGDALVRVNRPGGWPLSSQIRVAAVTENGLRLNLTGDASTEITESHIQFLWRREVLGYTVAYYLVEKRGVDIDPDLSDVEGEEEEWPDRVSLMSYPNPSTGSTVVELSFAPRSSGLPVTAAVYSAEGRRVKLLWTGPVGTADCRLVWDGTDDAGERVASGVYFLRVESGQNTLCRKMVVMR